MLRKTMTALFAVASISMLAPGVASARGGFHGGGLGASGFHAVAIGGGSGLRAAAIGSGIGRSAVIGGNGLRTSGFVGHGFPGDHFRHGFHGRRFLVGAGLGFAPYAYYDDYYDYPYYAYDDTYYDDGGCYVVRRRVHTRYGWRIQPIEVCG